MNYGEKIKQMREEAGIKQADLAASLEMTSQQLSSREIGTVAMTKAEYLGAMAAIDQIMRERQAAYERLTAATNNTP